MTLCHLVLEVCLFAKAERDQKKKGGGGSRSNLKIQKFRGVNTHFRGSQPMRLEKPGEK